MYFCKKTMLRILIFGFIFSSFYACSPASIKTELATSDSVAINFFDVNSKEDSVYKVIIIKDSIQIAKLASFIEASKISKTVCKYDGNLNFFKMNAIATRVDFGFRQTDCKQFTFLLNDALMHTKLNKEAENFLLELSK